MKGSYEFRVMSDEQGSASTHPGNLTSSVPGRVIMSIKTHNRASARKARPDAYNFTLSTLFFTLSFLSFWFSASPFIPHSALRIPHLEIPHLKPFFRLTLGTSLEILVTL